MESSFLISLFLFFFSFFCDKFKLNPQKRPKKGKNHRYGLLLPTKISLIERHKYGGRPYLEITVTSNENRDYSASPSAVE